MENSTRNSSCTTWCWLIAAAVGILAVLLLWTTQDWNFVPGAFAGLLIFIIGGALLSWLMCKPVASLSDTNSSAGTTSSTSAASNASASTSTSSGTTVAAVAATVGAAVTSSGDSNTASDVKPSAELAGSKELADRKGDWKYEKPEADAKTKAVAAKPVAKNLL